MTKIAGYAALASGILGIPMVGTLIVMFALFGVGATSALNEVR